MQLIQNEYVPGFQRRSRELFTLPGSKSMKRIPDSPLAKFCETIYEGGKRYRDSDLGMMDRWTNYRAWYLGSGGMNGGSLTYVNLIYELVEKLSADLSDGRPAFQFEPNTKADLPMSMFLNDAIPWIWDQHDLQALYYSALKATMIYGTWYQKVTHDPRYGSQGAVERTDEIPAWYMIPAPYATDPDRAPWMIEVYPRTVGEIWNDYGIRVDPEIGYGEYFPDVSEDLGGMYGGAGTATVVGYDIGGANEQLPGAVVDGIPNSFLSGTQRDGIVLQKELWIRDGSTEEDFFFKDDEKGVPQLMHTYGLKFPKGRVISWANGRVLYDRPNPYKDGRFPYVQFKDVSLPDFWYGLGEVHQQVNLQMLHDDTHEIIKQIHLYTATGRLINDSDTGLTSENMNTHPGAIWTTRPGTSDRLRWLQASPPSAEFYTYLNTLGDSKDLMAGTFDPSRGINPSGVTAGRALLTLQNAANTRVKARFNDLEKALTRWAKLMASRVQQFWPDQTAVRVTGSPVPEDSKFNEFRIRPEDRDANYSVKVLNTANMDAIKQADFQKLVLLAQAGIQMPPELLVKAANFSNAKEIEAIIAKTGMSMPVPQGASPTQQPQGAVQ